MTLRDVTDQLDYIGPTLEALNKAVEDMQQVAERLKDCALRVAEATLAQRLEPHPLDQKLADLRSRAQALEGRIAVLERATGSR